LTGCPPNPPDPARTGILAMLRQTNEPRPMRKIEQQMNKAIATLESGKSWKSANTSVVNADGILVVQLHGNKIAEIGENWIQLFDGGWQSNTTKSRLNAILSENGLPGEGIFQKNFEWFLNFQGNAIPFFSGMRLN
jgi:hypothetical protein